MKLQSRFLWGSLLLALGVVNMWLNYDTTPITRDSVVSSAGWLVVALDRLNVAQFDWVYTPGMPLAADERLLPYRIRDRELWVAPETFFFQEGHVPRYENALYAEIRVSPAGDIALIGLGDHGVKPLGNGP